MERTRRDKVNVPKIKSLMALNKETQGDLSAILNLTRGSVNRKMTGKENFTLQDIIAIANHYKVKPGELFSD